MNNNLKQLKNHYYFQFKKKSQNALFGNCFI